MVLFVVCDVCVVCGPNIFLSTDHTDHTDGRIVREGAVRLTGLWPVEKAVRKTSASRRVRVVRVVRGQTLAALQLAPLIGPKGLGARIRPEVWNRGRVHVPGG